MKRRLVEALMVVVMTTSLIGCSGSTEDNLMKEKKETVVSMYEELESNYEDLLSEYNTLKAKTDQLYADEEINPGITSLGDGTGDLTLNSVNGRVQFNSALQYPNSYSVSSTGYLNITDIVKITAKDNWVTRIQNSTAEMQHTSGISGSVNVSMVDSYMEDGDIKTTILEPWISQLTSENVEYSNIFIDGDAWGAQARFKALVDGEDGRIQCGVVTYGQYVVTYIFVYCGEVDSTKDEIIKTTLNTLQIAGTTVTTE